MPYNPQQNGIAKRMNRIILNMVRSMMFFKNVKLMFWVDAVLCVVYVKNRCPSNAIRHKNPYEKWYGHIPLVKHLRVFGSTCYALIPKVHKTNLVQGVVSVSSWGIQTPPKHTISMMKSIKSFLYLEM